MSTSAKRGAAFEYVTITEAINKLGATPFSQDTIDFITTKGLNAFNTLSNIEKDKMSRASITLIHELLKKEPWLNNGNLRVEHVVTVSGTPDVVDVYLHVQDRRVGISLKSNHDAARHSRISPRIDIAKTWLGLPTDEQYMHSIQNVFSNFLSYCNTNDIKFYRDLSDSQKDQLLYSPVTLTFENLLQRSIINGQNNQLALQNMVRYLIGNNDFYKAIGDFRRNQLTIKAFDLRGTLAPNQLLNLPTNCLNITRPTRNNTFHNYVNIECNNDWEIEMRIHNASSRIENSLKWDVKLKKVPQNIWIHTISF